MLSRSLRLALLALCLTAIGSALGQVVDPAAPVAPSPITPSTITPSTITPQVVRLPHPLTPALARQISVSGVRLLHHYGEGRYLASGPLAGATTLTLADVPATALTSSSLYQTGAELRGGLLADPKRGARDTARTAEVDIVVAFPGARAHLSGLLRDIGFAAAEQQFGGGVSLRGRVRLSAVAQLLAHPYVLDVSPALEDGQVLNDEARREHRTEILASGLPGGYDLDGSGVVVGIGDGGKLSGHPDVGRRVLYSTPWYNQGWGAHPDFVTSLVGGAGIIDERFRGTAPGTGLIIESSSSVTYYADDHLRDYGMTLTNNSYGPYFQCSTLNRYFGSAASLDQQLLRYPDLLHVFAAGNSGRASCDSSVAPFSTLLPGGQCAKNTLTVGNAYSKRGRLVYSSSGPTFDGRLKPEIIAVGHNVFGNDRESDYTGGSGTSLATPSVVGVLALLTQHYRRLHGGQNPSGALLKAVACNTADDIGRLGPDYEHGYGMISATDAARVLDAAQHRSDSLAVDQVATYPLEVSAGLERLRVMLYWHDRPGRTDNLGQTLVDDLDLVLVTPAGDTLRPWILDALHPAALAVRGVDTVNNIEQVTFDLPAAGTYRVVVTGRRQDYGATDYVLTWALDAPRVALTQPFGGERIDPAREVALAWEASPGQVGPWRVEYAPADIASPAWTVIEAGIESKARAVVWHEPATTGRFRFRVTNEATGLSDETDATVTMLATPTDLGASERCGTSARLSWRPVEGVSEYLVYRFDGDDMVPIGTTAESDYSLADLPADTAVLYSVSAVDAHGAESVRARAVFVGEEPESCSKAVPVRWVSVELEETPLGIRVHWSVDSEYDCDYYEVQRASALGRLPTWTTVGSVGARGLTDTRSDYAHTDAGTPSEQQSYYRIRQVDLDGTSDYSVVVVHDPRGTDVSKEAVTLSQNSPNALNISVAALGRAHAELFDVAGRRLSTIALHPGANEVPWPSEAGTGAYVVRVVAGGRTYAFKAVRS